MVAVFDELWAYSNERLRRLFDELVPPPTRRIACRLTVTYAGFEGESALLEELYNRGLQLPQVAPNLFAGDGMLMFWSHDPVAPWQTDAWVAEMRRSLRPNQFLRMIENRFVTTESSFVEMRAWDRCRRCSARPCCQRPRAVDLGWGRRLDQEGQHGHRRHNVGSEGAASAPGHAPRISAQP